MGKDKHQQFTDIDRATNRVFQIFFFKLKVIIGQEFFLILMPPRFFIFVLVC